MPEKAWLCILDTTRFKTAIIEAQDCLADYVNRLPAEMGKVFENLNADEKDALLVTFFKRGLEKEIESLDVQLKRIAQKGSKQRYLFLGEATGPAPLGAVRAYVLDKKALLVQVVAYSLLLLYWNTPLPGLLKHFIDSRFLYQ